MSMDYNERLSLLMKESQMKLREQIRLEMKKSFKMIDVTPLIEVQEKWLQELRCQLDDIFKDAFSNYSVAVNDLNEGVNERFEELKKALLIKLRSNILNMPYEIEIPNFTRSNVLTGIKRLAMDYNIEFEIDKAYDGHHGAIIIHFFGE